MIVSKSISLTWVSFQPATGTIFGFKRFAFGIRHRGERTVLVGEHATYGLFPSEQARKDWQNARKKLSRAKVKKPAVVDPDLIWSSPDGEIRRYDSRLNIICRECRKSEVMQRILAFYQGNFQDVAQ